MTVNLAVPNGKPEGLEDGWYVKPTIFADVSNNMRIAREEIFGPVLVIIPFDSEEQAIEIANDTDYGLAAYLQTGNTVRAERVCTRLRAGGIHINGQDAGYGSPFGGYKQSGNGREGGIYGLEDYQELKKYVRPSASVIRTLAIENSPDFSQMTCCLPWVIVQFPGGFLGNFVRQNT